MGHEPAPAEFAAEAFAVDAGWDIDESGELRRGQDIARAAELIGREQRVEQAEPAIRTELKLGRVLRSTRGGGFEECR